MLQKDCSSVTVSYNCPISYCDENGCITDDSDQNCNNRCDKVCKKTINYFNLKWSKEEEKQVDKFSYQQYNCEDTTIVILLYFLMPIFVILIVIIIIITLIICCLKRNQVIKIDVDKNKKRQQAKYEWEMKQIQEENELLKYQAKKENLNSVSNRSSNRSQITPLIQQTGSVFAASPKYNVSSSSKPNNFSYAMQTIRNNKGKNNLVNEFSQIETKCNNLSVNNRSSTIKLTQRSEIYDI